MSKIIKLVLNGAVSDVKAEDISCFSAGGRRGTGYVYILGAITPVTQDFETSRDEWIDYIRKQITSSPRLFEFKDQEGDPISVKLDDIKFIRRQNQFSVVHLVDNVSIRSNEDYYDLCERIAHAMC